MMRKGKLSCILFVDDDEPTNFINRMLVEQTGCAVQVEAVQGARDALDYLTGNGKFTGTPGRYPLPDLILLDVNMPAMDGWEFLDQYRELSFSQKEEIILFMLTTSLNPDDEIRAGKIPEVSGFRHKPFTTEMFREILTGFFESGS